METASDSVDSNIEKREGRATYRHPLKGHKGAIRDVAFRPDTLQLATAGDDRTVRIWDAQSGQCLTILQNHTDDVRCLTYNRQGTLLASGDEDGVIHLWRIDKWGHYQLRQTIQANHHGLRSMAFSPDGQTLAAGTHDRTLRLWDIETGACLQAANLTISASAVGFDPKGARLVTGQADGIIQIWDFSDRTLGTPTQIFRHAQAVVNAVAFSPSGELLVSGATDATLHVWDPTTGEEIYALDGYPQGISDIAFYPNHNLSVITGNDGWIRLYDIASRTLLHTLKAPGPYAGMNITGVTGISDAQRDALRALGAVEDDGVI